MMPMPLHPHYAAPVLPFIGACAVAAAALACRAAPVRPLLRWQEWPCLPPRSPTG
jgi:hypothetical protein